MGHSRLRKISCSEIIESTKSIRGLTPGTMDNVHIGYPFLSHLSFSVVDDSWKGLSLQIDERVSEEEILKSPVVFVDWPHLTPVKPLSLTDGRFELRWSRSSIERSRFNQLTSSYPIEEIRKNLLSKKIFAEPLLLFGLYYLGNKPSFSIPGLVSFEPAWNPDQSAFAAQTVVTNCPLSIPAPPPTVPLPSYMPPKSKFFLLTPQYYGCEAEVISLNGCLEVNVAIKIPEHPPKITKESFLPLTLIAQELKVAVSRLRAITEKLTIKGFEIGLNLKSDREGGQAVSEYFCMGRGATGLFSKKAVTLIQSYIEEFPEILGNLGTCDENKLEEMSNWVESQSYHDEARVSSACVRLCDADVENIVKTVSGFKEQSTSSNITVHPKDLYKPIDEIGPGPDPNATHESLDRVVCVRSGYFVQPGALGTIIGLVRSGPKCFWLYDIVFDDFCKPGFFPLIFRMSSRDFMNFDHGKRLQSRAPPQEFQEKPKEFWRRGCFIEDTRK